MRPALTIACALLLAAPAPASEPLQDEPLRPLAGGGLLPPANGVAAGEARLGSVRDAEAAGRRVLVASADGLWEVGEDGLLSAVPRPPGAGAPVDLAPAPGAAAFAVFADSQALWRVPVGGDAPEQVLTLPFAPRRLAALEDGSVVVGRDDTVAHVGPDGVVRASYRLPGSGPLSPAPGGGFLVASRAGVRHVAADGTSRGIGLGRLRPSVITGVATLPAGDVLVSGLRRLPAGVPPGQLLLSGDNPFATLAGGVFAEDGSGAVRGRVVAVVPGARADVLGEGGVGAMLGPGHGVTLDEASEQPHAIVPWEDDGALLLAGDEVWQAGGPSRPSAWLTQAGHRLVGQRLVEVEATTTGELTVTITRRGRVVASGRVQVSRPGPVEVPLDGVPPAGVLHVGLRLETPGGRVGASGTRLWHAPTASARAATVLAGRLARRTGRRTAARRCRARSAQLFECAWASAGGRAGHALRLRAREDGWVIDLLRGPTRR